jgi:inorganic pyrophosphatase
MPRGVRRSPIERLQDEIKNTQDSIVQYKEAIKHQEERLKQLQDEVKVEEFKEVSAILEEKNMSISELKNLLMSQDVE